jgi:hypothetical protein
LKVLQLDDSLPTEQGMMMMLNSSEKKKKKEEDIVAQLAQATTISKNACFDATQFPQLQEELKAHWEIAVNNNSRPPPLSDAWFDRIYRQHNETGRHYHTAVHLKEMLDYLQILLVGEEDTTTTTAFQCIAWQFSFMMSSTILNRVKMNEIVPCSLNSSARNLICQQTQRVLP